MSASSLSRAVVTTAPWVLASALVGALVFIVAQHVVGSPLDIAQFMGREIVRRGGYAPGLSLLFGWGVHSSVAVTYAALYAVVALAFLPREGTARWALGLGLAVVMGWLSTLVTAPAVAITISLLSGQGFPGSLPSLNTSVGFVFWNHVGFFLVSFTVTVLVRDLAGAKRVGLAAQPAVGTGGAA
jgi:hypothetical protein